MRFIDAEFLTSATAQTGWPESGPPEIAFIGRSNVGKSSLLQALVGRKKLVRISNTPGRTRLINFFNLTMEVRVGKAFPLRFVDLPGFGYAKVAKSERAAWRAFIEEYLLTRAPLKVALVLLDTRRVAEAPATMSEAHPLYEESELVHFLRDKGRQVICVLTKADQVNKSRRVPLQDRVKKMFAAPALLVSVNEDFGLEDLTAKIVQCVGKL